jgi:UDP-N-acetylglucosamine 1-carboxyvinyltransferase
MLEQIRVGKSRLEGQVTVSGAKNSSLKLLTASMLTSDAVRLNKVPCGIADFQVHLGMLRQMGKTVEEGMSSVIIKENGLHDSLVWDGRSIRNTLLMLGCMLTRLGRGSVPLPGGCKLGERKYDLHVMAMEKLGVKVWEEGDYLFAESKGRLKGTDIHLPVRSTGATENSILMGVLAEGETRIWNPHIRPEILDLIQMLREMGADISVYGQESILVRGVEGLNGVDYNCIPDNMEALTFAIGTAMTGGEVEINNFPLEHLEIPLIHLRESGLKYYRSVDGNSLIVRDSKIYPIEISTGPYPGINSDMQPLFAAFGLMAKGTSKIVDLRFPGRYQYGEEFAKMGGETEVVGDMFKIKGGKPLKGTTVKALDLRAGAALTLCGLVADGITTITNYLQVMRGYENFTDKLINLGAEVHRAD